LGDHWSLKRLNNSLWFVIFYRCVTLQPVDIHGQAFGSLPAPPTSEIGRAREAIVTITKAIVHHISSIPQSSELRTKQQEIFDIFGALQVTHDSYLLNGDGNITADLQTWTAFWARAQPVLLELGMKLDEKGFGMDLDELKKEADEKEKQSTSS
jgi:hypothetical protein